MAATGSTTTKIVFACNSNSCRSQMAEGWARKYLTEHDLMDEPIVVASVALDSKAVEKEIPFTELDRNNVSLGTEKMCCGDLCETVKQRKAVKSKAVYTMESLGVDMTSAKPKTWEELLPILTKASNQNEVDDMIFNQLNLTPQVDGDIFAGEADNQGPNIDRLIVLCSCGDQMRYNLGKISTLVEEWNVDAPTAMSKAGEGDKAYTRVSLEIKEKVHNLMKDFLPASA